MLYTLLAVLGSFAPTLLVPLGLGFETGETLIHLLVGVLGLVAGVYIVAEPEATVQGVPA